MTEPSAPDPLRTESESAEFLGVKPTTLQIWRSTGRYKLAYVKVGRLVRYRQSVLDAFLVTRTCEGSKDQPDQAAEPPKPSTRQRKTPASQPSAVA